MTAYYYKIPSYVMIGPLLLQGKLEAPEWPSAQVVSKVIDANHAIDEL